MPRNFAPTLLSAFICVVLAMSTAIALWDGLTSGDFGKVRNFGVVSATHRPGAFAAVAICYAAAMLATAAAAWTLMKRLGRS